MARRRVSGALTALAFVALPSTADGIVWSAPVSLEANVNISASAAACADGQTIAAWEGNTGVWVALSRPAGGFAEQRLSRAPIANVDSRLLAVDHRGDAVMAWETRGLPSPTGQGLPPGRLYVSYRPAGRRFGRPRLVAGDTAGADVGIDGRGDVTIVWAQARARAGSLGLNELVRSRAGRYSRRVRIVRGSVNGFGLAVNARDDAVLVWEQGRLPSPAVLWSTRQSGAAFGAAHQLVSSSEGAGPFDVGIDGAGQATIAWEGPYDGAGSGIPWRGVKVSTVQVGSSRHGRIQRLPTPGRAQLGETGVRLAVDARGDAAVVWDAAGRGRSLTPRIEVARRTTGRSFGRATTIGSGDTGGSFDVAIGAAGSLLVGWESSFAIEATYARGPLSPLGTPSKVSAPSDGASEPTVAIGRLGQRVVLWQDLGPNSGGGTTRLLLSSGVG